VVIRRHRDDALAMWQSIAEATRQKLCAFSDIGPEHPVWSSRPYKVFLKTPHEVRGRIQYVDLNPEKEGLSKQQFAFVQPYNNWPFHKTALARNPR
jgi:hypothetical protein